MRSSSAPPEPLAWSDADPAGGPTLGQILAEAFKYLGPRERTVAEVRAYLVRRSANVALIEAALSQLSEQGYLDDARYARCFAEDRRNLDGWGSERIYRRLLELGVDSELAHSCSESQDPEEEMQRALDLLGRKVRVAPYDPRSRQRAVELLLRRGYDSDVAYKAVRRFEELAA
jgi:regulatory protein